MGCVVIVGRSASPERLFDIIAGLHMVRAVVQGHNKYMQDLASLDKCRPVVAMEWPREVQTKLNMVVTPLRVERWAEALAQHPDHEFVGYLLWRVQFGFL